MHSAEKHLSPEQVEWLIKGKGSDAAGGAPVEFWDEAHQHLAQCTACEKLVYLHGEIEKRLDALKGREAQPSDENCPDQKAWWDVAAGILPAAEVEKLMDHAIQCDHCSPLLKEATKDLVSDATAHEASQIDALQSATADWQRAMAARVSGSQTLEALRTRVRARRRNWIPLAGWAFAAVALVLLGGFWLLGRDTVEKANRLIAEAYSSNRRSDFRIGQAQYGPLQTQRGVSNEVSNQMLEARAMLARLSVSHAGDPNLLQAQGRADLAAFDLAGALAVLTRARDLSPESSSILTDLGITYAELADAGQTESYQQALLSFDQALTQSPNDPIALYNRALLYERLQSFDHALQDWNAYLKLAPPDPWADEARKRAAADTEKLKKDQARVMDSSALLAWVQKVGDEESLRQRSEVLVDAAASDWIGDLPATKHALDLVSSTTRDWNRDPWLSELLLDLDKIEFATAASDLSRAVRDNNVGDHGNALSHARRSESEFSRMGNIAGKLRARSEIAYAMQRAAAARPCIAESREVHRLAHEHQYAWIEIQSTIVEAICAGMLGDQQNSVETLNLALANAGSHHFDSLTLRAQVMLSSMESADNRIQQAWRSDIDGLSQYWDGVSPPIRAYQFYSDLTTLAEKSGAWRAATSFGEESVREAHESSYSYAEAIAEFRLAEAFKNCSDAASSASHFDKASRLFSNLPPTAPNRLYHIDAEVRFASIDAQLSRPSVSLARLLTLEREVRSLDPDRIVLRYYNALGDLYLASGSLSAAQNSFETAIAISRHERATLKNPHERALLVQDSAASYRKLVNLMLMESRPDQAFATWQDFLGSEWTNPFSGPLRSNGYAVTTTEDVRRLLPKLAHDTFLSFIRSPDGLNIWVLNSDGLHFQHVDVSLDRLQTEVRRLTRLCSTPSSKPDELAASSRALYSWYIAPVASRLSSKGTLIVAPDPEDWNLPFGALEDSNGVFLASSFDLAQSSALTEWAHLRDPEPITPNATAVMVANPALSDSFSANLPPLPEAVEEVRSISVLFRAVKVFVGKDATVAAFTSSLPRVAVIHFAGHAGQMDGSTGLLLAQDHKSLSSATGFLDPSRIKSNSLSDTRLVVLAACSTGKRDLQDGLAGKNIAQMFQLAGVPNVIATRWDVDSAATRVFTEYFYQHLLKGKTVARASRTAVQAMMNDPATSHPYFWASFVVFGRG